jgi:DNA-directed RNA polymerase specialized sigma24 family protein
VDLDDFEDFAVDARPRLQRALLGVVGVDAVDDAVAEALAYGFEHWTDVRVMANPVGYLYRVGRSRTRPRRQAVRLFREPNVVIPDVEDGLVESLQRLPETQRVAVWLVHGCGWSHREVADVLGVGTSTVATHIARGMQRLRKDLRRIDVVA